MEDPSRYRCSPPIDDGEGMDDSETESNDDNNDHAPRDSVGRSHVPRGPRGSCGHKGPLGSMAPVAPVFMSLHVKCPTFSG